MDGTGDVAGATGTCRGTRRPEALANEFGLRTHIQDEWVSAPQCALQCLQRHKLWSLRGCESIGGWHQLREVCRPRQPRLLPILPCAVQHKHALVPVG